MPKEHIQICMTALNVGRTPNHPLILKKFRKNLTSKVEIFSEFMKCQGLIWGVPHKLEG